MSSLKKLSWLVPILVSAVLLAGCEEGNHHHDRNNDDQHHSPPPAETENPPIAVTQNTTTTVTPSPYVTSGPYVAPAPYDTSAPYVAPSTPYSPPAVNHPHITVINSSTHSVTVNGSSLGSGGSTGWDYSGSTTVTFDTLAGYSVTQTVNDGSSHVFNIYNSQSVPGTVEMSGTVE